LEGELETGMVRESVSYEGSRLNKSPQSVRNAADDSDGLRRSAWLPGIGGGGYVRQGASTTAVGAIAHSESFIKREAAKAEAQLKKMGNFSSGVPGGVGSVGGAAGTTAGATVERLAPEVYSPLFTMANLNLPRDRITINAWCFLPGTMVCMADGTRKPIEDIKIGDVVLSADGTPQEVTTLFERHVDEEIVGIRIKGSQKTIWSTTNHGFKAVRSGEVRCCNRKTYVKCKPGKIEGKFCEWCGREEDPYIFEKIAAGELSRRDFVYSPVLNVAPRSLAEAYFEYEEHMELLGYYAAEGSLSRNTGVYFNFGIHEENTASHVADLFHRIWGGKKPTLRKRLSKSNIQVECHNKHANSFYRENCGGISTSKKLSYDVVRASPEVLVHFLKAWLDGDGSQEKYNADIFSGNTSSEDLAWQVRTIALRCGLVAHVFEDSSQNTMISPTNGKRYNASTRYYVKFRGKSALRLSEFFETSLYRFGEVERKYVRDGVSFIHNDKLIQWINNVERKQYTGPVYNIEVSGTHTYVVEDVAVYNCRNFFQLHPIVRNAITLHATYPISKLNLKCHDKKVLQFFEDMIEEMDLMNALGDISLEYWKLGECFPFAELNEKTGKWSRVVIQNPDYIHVKKTVLSSDPIVTLKPDAVLQRLVFSNNPADAQLRRQIPEKIIYHVRTGQNIPLDSFNVSHLKMLSSPYDVRGTSVIVSVFKDLMLYDKLRECFPIFTEVLTKDGFKFYDDVMPEDEIATVNPKTNELEFQKYINRTDYEFDGDLYHFSGKKIDTMVTPNHRMWLSKKKTHHKGYNDFQFVRAEDVKIGCFYRSQAVINKYSGKEVSHIDLFDSKIPTEDYLEFLGYVISEGCIHFNENTQQYGLSFCQNKNTRNHLFFKNSIEKIGGLLNVHIGSYDRINKNGFSSNEDNEITRWTISRKHVVKHFFDEIGSGSRNKHIPYWIKQLSPRLLKILLKALVRGDGSEINSRYKNGSMSYRYHTISKQLADDVQEILFKCGYASHLMLDKNGQDKEFYLITWSDSNYGKNPVIYGNSKNTNNTGAFIEKVPYKGRVFCFEVPNGLFVTRNNGLITIQGNSKFAQADGMVNPVTLIKVGGNTEGEYRATQEDLEFFRQMFEEAQYDKDFKLITHAGVTVERVGFSGQVLDIAGDLEFITKNIYTGLMVPPAVVDTESAAYSSASIGLEVLRQRYFNFRNMIARWLVNKIFAPISEVQEFYEYKNKEKHLIVPEVEWNQMNLYDLQDYIGNITGMVSAGQASVQTLYKSLGLSYQDERVKMRQEAIDKAIKMREENALSSMSLTELRSLDPEKPIMDPIDSKEREKATPPEAGAPAGMPGKEMGMPGGEMGGAPGGLPELAPPPGGEMGGEVPGAGAPEGGVTPPLGPGAGAGGP
jgi:intein/homing endonuclease